MGKDDLGVSFEYLQVGPEVDERELIAAFEKHGSLSGYKLLRGSMCGFIDFERIEDAAAARFALHEAEFADCELRVEYKVASESCSPAKLLVMQRQFIEDTILPLSLPKVKLCIPAAGREGQSQACMP